MQCEQAGDTKLADSSLRFAAFGTTSIFFRDNKPLAIRRAGVRICNECAVAGKNGGPVLIYVVM
jgi:hypothetical protein